MTALALPDPQAITPAQVSHYGAVVLQAAEATSDVHEVQDISNKWAAIAEYLRRTTADGLNEARRTELHLLRRIGELSPAQPGPGRGHTEKNTELGNLSDQGKLAPNRLAEARKLAASPEVIDDSPSVYAGPLKKLVQLGLLLDAPLPDDDHRDRWYTATDSQLWSAAVQLAERSDGDAL